MIRIELQSAELISAEEDGADLHKSVIDPVKLKEQINDTRSIPGNHFDAFPIQWLSSFAIVVLKNSFPSSHDFQKSSRRKVCLLMETVLP
jgi:hypothetical protein